MNSVGFVEFERQYKPSHGVLSHVQCGAAKIIWPDRFSRIEDKQTDRQAKHLYKCVQCYIKEKTII